MTQPTDIPVPPGAPEASPPPGAQPGQEQPQAPAPDQPLTLRRTLRTATSESYDLAGADGARIGTLTVVYGDDGIEGLFALPADTSPDLVRGLLGWVTDMLNLDVAAGGGRDIHWVVSTGALEDFWRRSPGRRSTGAEVDLAAARARVEAVLGQMFPAVQELPDGGLAVDAGSVRVFVQIRLVDAVVMVRVFAITNLGVRLDDGLAAFLLGLNFTLALGRFSVDAPNGAVWFDHVLTSEALDDATLARAVGAVAATADRYDDEIKQRFGGRTFREEGSPVEHVTTPGPPGMAGGYL